MIIIINQNITPLGLTLWVAMNLTDESYGFVLVSANWLVLFADHVTTRAVTDCF